MFNVSTLRENDSLLKLSMRPSPSRARLDGINQMCRVNANVTTPDVVVRRLHHQTSGMIRYGSVVWRCKRMAITHLFARASSCVLHAIIR
jgi:thiamine transporter ThiT